MINAQNDLAERRVSTPKIPFFIVLAFCIPVALTARTLAYIDPANHDLVGLDFRAFYTAGKMLLADARLYDLMQQWVWQKALWPELSHSSELLYIPYPPFDILPMALVAMLPLHLAYAAWLAAQTLILSALCFLMVNSSDHISPRTRLILLAVCLSALPVLVFAPSSRSGRNAVERRRIDGIVGVAGRNRWPARLCAAFGGGISMGRGVWNSSAIHALLPSLTIANQ